VFSSEARCLAVLLAGRLLAGNPHYHYMQPVKDVEVTSAAQLPAQLPAPLFKSDLLSSQAMLESECMAEDAGLVSRDKISYKACGVDKCACMHPQTLVRRPVLPLKLLEKESPPLIVRKLNTVQRIQKKVEAGM
jgi:hypothetical protein